MKKEWCIFQQLHIDVLICALIFPILLPTLTFFVDEFYCLFNPLYSVTFWNILCFFFLDVYSPGNDSHFIGGRFEFSLDTPSDSCSLATSGEDKDYNDVVFTRLGGCKHLTEIDMYVKFSCDAPGTASISLGEDALCLDSDYSISLNNGECKYLFS